MKRFMNIFTVHYIILQFFPYFKVNEKSAEGLKSKRDSSSNYQSFVHDGMGNPPPGNRFLSKAIQS